MVKQRMDERPNYFHGQLLQEGDFLAEQQYHIRARHLHNLRLHGSGIVTGLEVEPSGETAVTVRPGFAIDEQGREVVVRDPLTIDLSTFGERDVLRISLSSEEEKPQQEPDKRLTSFAVASASHEAEKAAGLTLAVVQLDERAKVRSDAINNSSRKYASPVLGPGSVTVSALERRLRTGWLKLPFRPIALEKGPPGEEEIPPPFRVGATEARSLDELGGKKNDRGAGGTMAIPIPPGVTRITRFRVAGENNERGVQVKLMLGGWDPKARAHVRKALVDEKIPPGSPDQIGKTRYEATYDVKGLDIDPEYNTLSLWLRGLRKTSVSLVAVEFSY